VRIGHDVDQRRVHRDVAFQHYLDLAVLGPAGHLLRGHGGRVDLAGRRALARQPVPDRGGRQQVRLGDAADGAQHGQVEAVCVCRP